MTRCGAVTGPIRPRLKPPGLGRTRVEVTYAMMSRFSLGVIVVLLKTGIASGPVSMAS